MERELKAKLDEAIRAAVEYHMGGSISPESGSIDTKTGPIHHEPGPVNPDAIVKTVKKRLGNLGVWTEVQSQLALESIAMSAQRQLDRIHRASIDAAQMTLEGFEHLPKRIGKDPLAEVTLKTFFAYRDKYSKRADREKARVDELDNLAKKVAPIYGEHPDITLADAVRRADAVPETKPYLVKTAATK